MGNGPTQVAMACLLAQRVGSPRRSDTLPGLYRHTEVSSRVDGVSDMVHVYIVRCNFAKPEQMKKMECLV